MNHHRPNVPLWTACVALASLLLGCAGTTTQQKEFFILKATRHRAPAQSRTDATLEVNCLSVDTAFATKNLLYRTSAFEYEIDYYRQFMVSPNVMLTERTRDWLAESGLFGRVLPAGKSLDAPYALDGNVTALYGDFTDTTAPTAVIEVRYLLMAGEAGERVVFTKSYRAATPVPARTAEAFVTALDASLVDILTQLEADLQEHLP